MRRVLAVLVVLATSSAAMAENNPVATRLVLSLGAGLGAVDALPGCYCGSTAGAGVPVGVGLEVAGRHMALELSARLLTVADGRSDTTGLAPSLLLAARFTPGRAILEIGGGAGYLWARSPGGDGDLSAPAPLVHAAVGARLTDRLRLLAAGDLMIANDGIGVFLGGVLEAAFGPLTI
jgi:hypothetical protein